MGCCFSSPTSPSRPATSPTPVLDLTSELAGDSESTWDYKSPYHGECDQYVLENPPTGMSTGWNANGNKWTNLGNGAYHYSNYGTDGGFYIKNADGSTYHYSSTKGGRYNDSSTLISW